MELRLGNQQRHSITAVLLSTVVIIFGLVIVDIVSSPEPDPLGARTEAIDTPSTSSDVEMSAAADDLTAGVARSNARFTLNPDVTEVEAEPSTSMTTATTTARRTTEASVVTSASTTSISTTATSSTSISSTTSTTTELPVPSSSTSTTRVNRPGKPSTTVVDDETTTTKKCRANRPECRKP